MITRLIDQWQVWMGGGGGGGGGGWCWGQRFHPPDSKQMEERAGSGPPHRAPEGGEALREQEEDVALGGGAPSL